MSPYPVIIVPGIGQSRTVLADTGKRAWPLDIDMDALKKSLIPAAAAMLLTRHDCGFEKALRNALGNALDPLRSTDDGNTKHDVRVVTYENSLAECTEDERHFISRMVPYAAFSEAVGEDRLYYFAYNPMGNAEETVERLRKFAESVKAKHSAEKVGLIAISLGGTILTQYLDKYVGEGDIYRAVGIVPAFDGSRIISGIFEKNISFENIGGLLELLLGKGDMAALRKVTSKVPEKLLRRYADAMLDALTEEVLLRCPMMWGTAPAAKYPALRDKWIGDKKFAGLRAKTDVSYRIRSDFPALVEKCRAAGTDIYSLCGSGLHLVAVDDDADSDGIVHLESCRMGTPSPIAENVRVFPGMDHEGAATQKTLLALCGALLQSEVPQNIQSFES